MKKLLVFFLLSAIIFFPPVSLYFASKAEEHLRDREYDLEQQKLIVQDFKSLEKKRNFESNFAQELSVFKEYFETLRKDMCNNFDLIRADLKSNMKDFCNKFAFKSQIEVIYNFDGRIERESYGEDLGLKQIASAFCDEGEVDKYLIVKDSPWEKGGENKFQRYMHRFASLYKTREVLQIVLQEKKSKKTFLTTGIELQNGKYIVVFAIADLSNVTNFIHLKARLREHPARDYGIAAYDRKSRIVAFSNFYKNLPELKKTTLEAISKELTLKNITHIKNCRVYIEKKVSRSDILLLGVFPEIETKKNELSLLIGVLFLLSCILFKIMAEKLFLGRGPDLSLSLLIPALFALLIIQPVFASVYLAEEYMNTSYISKKSDVLGKLDNEMRELDDLAKDDFVVGLNRVRGFNSIERIEQLVGMELEKSEDKRFLLKFADKIGNGKDYVQFASLWISTADRKSFTIGRFTEGRLELMERKSPISEIFFNRFFEKLDRLTDKKKTSGSLSAGDLKAEFARDFFINVLGPDSFYKFRRTSDLFLDAHSFYKHDYFFGFPVTYKGKYFAIFAWHFNESSAKRGFLMSRLSNKKEAPRIALFGDEKKILTHPGKLPVLESKFPELLECGKEAHLSRSTISRVIKKKDRSKSIIAVPLNFTSMTMAGYEWLQNFDTYKSELMKKAALLLAILFALGLLLAWSGARYFAAPIKELTMATEEINNGNYSVQIASTHPDEFAEIGNSFNKMARGLHEGKVLKSFVSGSVLKEVALGSENLSEKARQSFATIVFSGIRDFKKIQMENSATEIFDLLQKHLLVATEAISKYGGEIDKMIEDKIMIVFEHDEEDSEQHQKGILAAIEIQKRMMAIHSVEVAIGINSGVTISGIMGAEKARLAHTVVGDPVNLAARLTSEALKMEKSEVIISGYLTQFLPKDLIAEKLPVSSVKGKTQTIEAFVVRKA